MVTFRISGVPTDPKLSLHNSNNALHFNTRTWRLVILTLTTGLAINHTRRHEKVLSEQHTAKLFMSPSIDRA